jgi:hypothetical protein
MDNFIAGNVVRCGRCIRQKALTNTAASVPIQSMAPMDKLCIDYLSLERSKGGFENIIVPTDHFIRYAHAFPTRNPTVKTTAIILLDNFLFIMDSRPEFTVIKVRILNRPLSRNCVALLESQRLKQHLITRWGREWWKGFTKRYSR